MQTRYLRAIIAILFVSGVAGTTFFVSNRLSTSQNVAPNAPESEPQAFSSTIRNGIRLPDEDIVDIQRTTTPKSSAPVVGRSDEKDYDPVEVSRPNPTPIKSTAPTPNNPVAISTPTPIKTPEPTPKPGEYGSTAPEEKRNDPNSYMSDANNACTDGFGFISGTGCFNGVRKVLNIPETQRAYQEHVNKAQDKIFSASDAELIDLAFSDTTNNKCPKDDIACNIKFGQEKLFEQNLIINLEDKERLSAEIALRDVIRLSTTDLEIKYGTTDRAVILASNKVPNSVDIADASLLISLYQESKSPVSAMIEVICDKNIDCKNDLRGQTIDSILKQGIGNKLNSLYVDQVINDKRIQADSNYYVDLYLDQSLSDGEKVKRYCEKAGISDVSCRNTVNIDMLASYSSEPNTLISLKNDQHLAKLFSDAQNGTTDLAKIYCDTLTNPGPKCRDEYNQNAFLSLINSAEIKQQAINNRYTALNNLIPLVVQGKPVQGIDTETKKEVIKLNEQTTQAYWVFLKENRARQLQGVSNEQLALEFDKLLKENPTILSQKLALYNQNPSLYKLPTSIKFDKEENPLIVAQYNQIIKTQPIKGLFENNKIVTWNQAGTEYKEEVRKLACAEDKSIAIYCLAIIGYNSNLTSEEQKRTAIAQIDAVIANKDKQTTYLQQIYNSRTTDNLLTINQSNLATVDNTATDPVLRAEIEKAKLSAENKEAENILFNPKYGFGNMSGTSISVPASVREQLPEPQKLTEQQKTDLANEYLRRQLVIETYTRGTGIGGALASAAIATSVCSGAGGLALFCGGLGGFAGVVSNIVPILGNATAEEIEAERQKLVKIVGNDAAASLIQAMYSNQGAASDESIFGGRSQSNLNNQYALLEKIHDLNYQYGATTDSFVEADYQAEIALQPFLLQQGEMIQDENAQQAKVNLVVAPIVGVVSAGVGSNIVNQASQVGGSLLKNIAIDTALWAGGSLVNVAQTQVQFQSTVDYIDTTAEIEYTKCVRQFGSAVCDPLSDLVRETNIQANLDTQYQAFITDAIIQAGQTGTTLSLELGNRATQIIRGSQPPTTPASATQINLDTAINNLISSSARIETANTPQAIAGAPASLPLSTNIKNIINEITSDTIVKRDQPQTTIAEIKADSTIDNTDKIFLVTILEKNKPSSQEFFKNPNSDNFAKFVNDINESARTLAPQFDGNENTAKAWIIEALETIETRENLSGRFPTEIAALINATKVQAEIYNPTGNSTSAYSEATPIDPLTVALERLIDQRSRTDQDLTLDQVKIQLEGLEQNLTNERIEFIHTLQQTPDFQEAVRQVANARNQAEATQKTFLNTDVSSLFEQSSNKIIFDKTAELAKKISDSNSKSQPSTPPPPIPPTSPSTNTIDDQATLIAPTRPKLTQDQKNRLVEIYIKEIDSFGSQKFANEAERMDTYNNIIGKYIEYGLVFDLTGRTNTTQPLIPNGYGVTNIALIRLKNRFNDPGSLARLTPTQQAEISNLITAVDRTTGESRTTLQKVLDERVNSLLSGEPDINLPTTTTSSNTTPITYENTINLPKEVFTDEQLVGINNLIDAINIASPKHKESLIQALNQAVNEYTNSTPQVDLLAEILPTQNRNFLGRVIDRAKQFLGNINEKGAISLGLVPKNISTETEIGPMGILITKKTTTEYSSSQKTQILKQLGIKQTYEQVKQDPLLSTYKILRETGATDHQIAQEFPKLVLRYRPSFFLELYNVKPNTTYQEYRSNFPDSSIDEEVAINSYWIFGQGDFVRNSQDHITLLEKLNTPKEIIDSYLSNPTEIEDTPLLSYKRPETNRDLNSIALNTYSKVTNIIAKNSQKIAQFDPFQIVKSLTISLRALSLVIEDILNSNPCEEGTSQLSGSTGDCELETLETSARYTANQAFPTPTPDTRKVINRNSNTKTDLINNTYSSIIQCDQNKTEYEQNNRFIGAQMKQCYCNNTIEKSDDGKVITCEDGSLSGQISDQLNHLYNNNVEYSTDNLLFFISPIIGIDITSKNICQENRLCNDNNEPKYAICDLGTATRVFSTDIITTSDDNIRFCPKPWIDDQKGNTICETSVYIDEKTNTIKTGQITIPNSQIKQIWRSAEYSENNPCWSDK